MSLILKTTDIDPTLNVSAYTSNTLVDNEKGTLSKFRTEMVFKNIDLELLVGKYAFNKYEYFNIELVQQMSIVQSNGGNILKWASKPENTLLDLYIGGLNWVNSSYNQTNKTEAYITSLSTQQDLQDGNFVLNGDFENNNLTNTYQWLINDATSLPFWKGNNLNFDDNNTSVQTAYPFPSGNQAIKTFGTNTNVYIESIAYYFEAGIEYELSFYSAKRTGYTGNQFTAKIGTTTVFPAFTPTASTWVKHTVYYTPIANAYEKIRFDFAVQTGYSSGLDWVQCKKRYDTTQTFGYNQDQISYEKSDLKFKKSSKFVDISLKLKNTSGTISLTGITYNEIYPHQIFKFKITPDLSV